ncbi:nuclear factor 1 C-type isoform X4, partial [Tachysurus ichikawai]
MDSPSPQESSPRLGSFTQHHRPVIAVHSGISRSPHPSSSLHFSTAPILPQPTSTYFPHTAIRYPPHLTSQDPLKDLVTMACDPSNQQPSPLNGSGQVKVPPHYISSQMLAPPPPPALPRLTLPPDSKPSSTSPDAAASSPTSPTYSAPGTPPANRFSVGIGPRDPASLYQAQIAVTLACVCGRKIKEVKEERKEGRVCPRSRMLTSRAVWLLGETRHDVIVSSSFGLAQKANANAKAQRYSAICWMLGVVSFAFKALGVKKFLRLLVFEDGASTFLSPLLSCVRWQRSLWCRLVPKHHSRVLFQLQDTVQLLGSSIYSSG